MNSKLIIGVLTLTCLGLVVFLSPRIIPFTADTAEYIEAMKSIKEGRGLVVSEYDVLPVEEDEKLMILFPPGYSILTALLSLCGVDDVLATRLVPSLLYLFFPLLFYILSKMFFDKKTALSVTIACCLTQAIFFYAVKSMSDLPYLFFALLSFICLFKGIHKTRGRLIFLAGLLAGFGLLIRNVGYALIFSELVGLSFCALWGLWPWKKAITYGFVFGMGGLITYGPLLLRNIIHFGSIQPYTMPPSDVTLTLTVKQYLWTLSETFLGTAQWTFGFVVVLGIFVLSGVIYLFKRGVFASLMSQEKIKGIYFSTIMVYAFVGSALVVYSRSKYLWGADVTIRNHMQHAWVIIFFVSLILSIYGRWCHDKWRWPVARIGYIIVGLYVIIQIFALRPYVAMHALRMVNYQKLTAIVEDLKAYPKEAYIISNQGYFLRILTGRNIRQLDSTTPEYLIKEVTGLRPLVVVLTGHEFKGFSLWRDLYKGEDVAGYNYILEKGPVKVFHGTNKFLEGKTTGSVQ